MKNCLENPNGFDYDGHTSKTEGGRTCQRWDSQEPHPHNYHDMVDQENYCRNVDNDSERPWCFTTDEDKNWEYCDVPFCGKFDMLVFKSHHTKPHVK